MRRARLRGGACERLRERRTAAGLIEVPRDLRQSPQRISSLAVQIRSHDHRAGDGRDQTAQTRCDESRFDRLRSGKGDDADSCFTRAEIAQVARRDGALRERRGLRKSGRRGKPQVPVGRHARTGEVQGDQVATEQRQCIVDRRHEPVAEERIRMAGRPGQLARRLADALVVLAGGKVDGAARDRRRAWRASDEQDVGARFARGERSAAPGEPTSDDDDVGGQRQGLPPASLSAPVVK